MNFLIDAQLPRRLARLLNEAGHDAIHTLDLPLANRTQDSDIARLADQTQRIVVTKDSDFVSRLVLHASPKRLLLIATGNLNNTQLEGLFLRNLPQLEATFTKHSFVELGWNSITIHH